MRSIPLTALLAVMALLGACGGDDDSAPAAPEHAPAIAAAPASAPLRAAPAAAPAPAPAPPLPSLAAPRSAPPPNDMAQLRQEVASLRREVAELRMILARAPSAPQAAAALATPLAAPLAGETLAVAPAETMFRAEQVDQAWSNQASSAVRAALARTNAGLESQVRRLECRTKTCRVELNPASADQFEGAMAAVLANLGATLPNMTATQVGSDDGSEATVLYLTR